MPEGNLLYLDVAPFEGGKVLRGGALVTDATTEPLEFRCTSAVRPTALQKVLWGARLDGQIACNLVGVPLMKALRQPYSLIAVRNPDFMEMRENLDLPMVLLSRDTAIEFSDSSASSDDESLEARAEDDQRSPGDEDSEAVLSNSSGRFEPVILRCHEAYKQDLPDCRSVLGPVFARRDVLEPFERIAAALVAVHEQDTRE